MNLTNRHGNHTQFSICKNVRFLRVTSNSNSGSDQTKLSIDKVTFTCHMSVELMNNNSTAKEQNYGHVNAFKKKTSKFKVIFVTPGMDKIGKQFLPQSYHSNPSTQ